MSVWCKMERLGLTLNTKTIWADKRWPYYYYNMVKAVVLSLIWLNYSKFVIRLWRTSCLLHNRLTFNIKFPILCFRSPTNTDFQSRRRHQIFVCDNSRPLVLFWKKCYMYKELDCHLNLRWLFKFTSRLRQGHNILQAFSVLRLVWKQLYIVASNAPMCITSLYLVIVSGHRDHGAISIKRHSPTWTPSPAAETK